MLYVVITRMNLADIYMKPSQYGMGRIATNLNDESELKDEI